MSTEHIFEICRALIMFKKEFVCSNIDEYELLQLSRKKKLYMTTHSASRILMRNIANDDIVETFENPDIVIPNADYINAHNYVKFLKDKKLKIGVKDDCDLYVLITAFYINQ